MDDEWSRMEYLCPRYLIQGRMSFLELCLPLLCSDLRACAKLGYANREEGGRADVIVIGGMVEMIVVVNVGDVAVHLLPIGFAGMHEYWILEDGRV